MKKVKYGIICISAYLIFSSIISFMLYLLSSIWDTGFPIWLGFVFGLFFLVIILDLDDEENLEDG